MEIGYILLLIGLVGTLVGVIFNALQARIKYLELQFISTEKRVQKIEDVQGSKIDNMSLELKEFQNEVRVKLESLGNMIHRDVNQEQQLNKTLSLLLAKLTEHHE
jgi:hypothetical protein